MRLTKSICFAIEMARTCLQTSRKYQNMDLDKLWDSLEVKVTGTKERVISLRIHVRDFPRTVWATCTVAAGDAGEWSYGECRIELRGNNADVTNFLCVYNQMGRMQCWATSCGLKELGLEPDLLSDLQAANVLTLVELLSLDQLAVCRIFQPKDDPYLLTHPNPTEYTDRITFDKLSRLERALEEKNLRLNGQRRTRQELTAQL